MAKKAPQSTSLKQWITTDKTTRRLRRQVKRADRQGCTKKEMQELVKAHAADVLLRKAHPTAAAIVFETLENTKWLGIVNSILAN